MYVAGKMHVHKLGVSIGVQSQDVLYFNWVFSEISSTNVKVKCTLVQALRLCTGRMAHKGNRGIALLFHDQRH